MCASASLFHSFSNSDDTFANTGFMSESKSWCRVYQLMKIGKKRSDYITVQICSSFKARGLVAGNILILLSDIYINVTECMMGRR